MNIDSRVKTLERGICPECRRPLVPLHEQNENGETPTIDITALSTEQKRDLLKRLYHDKYPADLPPENLEEFRKLEMPEQLRAIRDDYEKRW